MAFLLETEGMKLGHCKQIVMEVQLRADLEFHKGMLTEMFTYMTNKSSV